MPHVAPEPATELDRVLREEGRRADWLAAQVDITPSYLSRLRRGHVTGADDLAQRILTTLGRSDVDPASLFSPPCLAHAAHPTEENDG